MMMEYNLQFFAKDGPGGEKTEDPTSKKKEDTRKEGQVAKSEEVSNAITILMLFLVIRFYIGVIGSRFMEFFSGVYGSIPDVIILYDGKLPELTIRGLFFNMIFYVVIIVGPIMLICLVLGIVANLLQFKFMVTTKPLKPKLSKLNPIKGFKKILSLNSLMKFVLSLAKIIIIGLVSFQYLQGRVDDIYLLYSISLDQALGLLGEIIVELGLRIAMWYVIIAIADLVYQRIKHRNEIKMTKQEVKDEFKNQEGDPQIKGQQKQRMRQASQRRMMQMLPEADVVITNPTHYAVAIKYDSEKYAAPIVLAKGADYIALKIKEAAKEHGIEIVENKPLARMLYTNVEIGELVPPELYQAVAEVLAMVYHLKGTA